MRSVTAQVHECAATGAIHVPEPRAMRTEMFLALFHQINFPEGAGIRHFFRLQIFRREQKLLTVHHRTP